MSEFRRDPTSGAWVLVAPERARRPGAAEAGRAGACPFCPGNESLLPGILEEWPSAEPPGWALRVLPNRFPALTEEPGAPAEGALPGNALPGNTLPGNTLPGFGYHEVIVETPDHEGELAHAPHGRIESLLRCYRARMQGLLERPGVSRVVVFRNRGPRAGASLAHPHSQVVAGALPAAGPADDWARARQAASGRCPTCEMIERELADGRRVVEATPAFVALVPFAATVPCELWLLPRRHRACFARSEDGALGEFAGLLGRSLGRLAAALEDPPYNYALDSAPAGEAEAPHRHWRLRLVPELVRPGGFELATGIAIDPASPEADADRLRRAGNAG